MKKSHISSNKSTSASVARAIATHSIVVAVFTTPWVMVFVSDVYSILTQDITSSVEPMSAHIRAGMTAVSTIALISALVSGLFWLVKRSK